MMLWVKGIEVRAVYEEDVVQGPPTLFMTTHASTLDVCSTLAHSKVIVNFISKESLFYIPFFGICNLRAGSISIKRTDRESAIKSLKLAAQRIKDEKKNICIAPEGTRRRSKSIGNGSQLLPFKKGPFYLAKDAEASIIPVVYMGCRRLSSSGGLGYNEGK
jgi:1-acyl-sn-glycerol-3-phosphate acyltransferase